MLKGNIVIIDKKPSEELQKLVKSFAYTTLERADIVEKIIIKANEEDIKPQQIGEMIKDILRKKGISESTIARSIPDDFKNKKMQAIRSKRKRSVAKTEQLHQDVASPLGETIIDWKDIHLKSINIMELRNWCNTQIHNKRTTVRGYIDDSLY